ncbi:hypothetical protein [Bradyrhizobium nanningense]|uniref:hypothetical protein n=1 Tax=Bradyrhizobium nanningense TaxID=1325118 RepID=UPI0013E8BC4E|nr:hypothetical protein [Bradyrhizobium nanningense]
MTESDNRREVSMVTERGKIESYKEEIAQLKQLVVQLSEIVLCKVIKEHQSRESKHP